MVWGELIANDPITVKLLISFAVILAGFGIAKLIEKIIVFFLRKKSGTSIKKPLIAKIAFNAIVSLAIVLALWILSVDLQAESFLHLYSYAPSIISAVLLFVLLTLLINLIIFIIKNFLAVSGVQSILDEYGNEYIVSIVLFIARILLYVVGILIILQISGFDTANFTRIIGYVIYPVIIFVLLLILIGTRDVARNMINGYYLKTKHIVRIGEYLIIDGDEVKVIETSSTGIVGQKKNGFRIFIPFSMIMEKGITYKKVDNEFMNLNKIKDIFTAQMPSYCGPASASMILKVFGYEVSQEQIGEKAKTIIPKKGEPGGTKPDVLIKVVENLTKKEVTGVWIDCDHISDLKNELKSWLSEGALVIIDYKKSYLFPEALKAHYSVCLSVDGDELLILDPSSKKGGVYYVDYRRVYAGMDTYSELIGGKRGYIVFAPDGTPAYERISKGLVFMDAKLKDKISKNLFKRLEKIHNSTSKIEKVLPKRVKSFLDKESKSEKISRIWDPRNQ